MKRLIFTIFFIFIALNAIAQESTITIYGKVVDKFTQQPLPGANVLVVNTNFGASTDLNGRFEIKNIPSGEYQLRASILGYRSVTKTDVMVMSGFPPEVIFELEEEAIELEDVVVRSDYFETSRLDLVSTRGFTNEEIRRSPGGFEDVIRALSILPGVAQADAGRNDLVVRGGAPSENLYLIDGYRVQNINHFGTQGATGGPLSYINLDFVSGTSFSTGGFLVNNGDKLSSTLAIDLRNGRQDRIGGKATISATQFGLNVEGPISNGSQFLFSARRSYLDFIFKAADFSFVPEYWDILGKADFEIDKSNSISFLLITAIDNINYFNDTEDQRYDNSRIIGSEQLQYLTGIKYRHLIDNGFINLSLSRNFVDFDTQQRDSLLVPVYLNKSKEKENTFNAELTYKLSNKTDITLGGDAKLINFEANILLPNYTTTFGDSLPTTALDTSTTYYKSSVYLNYNTVFLDKFITNLGVRADYFNVLDKKFYFSPRASFSYLLSDITRINFSTGIYYQSPSYLWLVGSPSNTKLKNIQVNQFILGFDHYVSADALIKVEGFYKDYSDYPVSLIRTYLTLANTGAGFGDENYESFGLEPLTSAGTGEARGVEFSLQKKLSDTPYYGIASLTYSVADYAALDKIDRTGSYDQTWIVSISGGYKISPEWETSLKFRYSTGRPFTPYNIDGTQNISNYNSVRFPESHSLDVRVDKYWFFSGWSLITYIDIQNIYNRKNISNVRWDVRTQSPEFNEAIGILPSIGISAVF
ncbi:MAG: TonB-dependent receptor [Ignavibacteria bacterium]|nr:TonB-dependent receptor [Ignavibacteria bacterium]MBT8392335.1 TonB-dependent receptor [Ignavibacteria bacterium]NNJ53249.1 TonB-dependent receptor [Ignavibacteriaceae bacterium]NNL19971.1 TonB-dependent receptor [Ignavibacteriaceae bacterium]